MAEEDNQFEEVKKPKENKSAAVPAKEAAKSVENAANDGKLKALRMAMDKIEKNFGKGSIMKLGDENFENVDVIPSGSIGLDAALGVGGYPRGRVIEIYGPESSGKTTLAIHAIAEAQKLGGIAAFIDAEHAFDRFYAENLGVDVDNLWISQPDNGEQALEIAESLIRSSAIDIIVIDSVAALVPKAEIEGEMGEKQMGLQARLMSQALRKLTAAISKTNTTCIFINQLREKIGIMDYKGYIKADKVPSVLNNSSILLQLANKADEHGPKGIMSTKIFEAMAVEKPLLCVRSDESFLEQLISKTRTGSSARTAEQAYDFILNQLNIWKKEGFTSNINQDKTLVS